MTLKESSLLIIVVFFNNYRRNSVSSSLMLAQKRDFNILDFNRLGRCSAFRSMLLASAFWHTQAELLFLRTEIVLTFHKVLPNVGLGQLVRYVYCIVVILYTRGLKLINVNKTKLSLIFQNQAYHFLKWSTIVILFVIVFIVYRTFHNLRHDVI